MDIELVLGKLKQKRSVFHSEADFQFALAWEIQSAYPDANVRLEYCPVCSPNMHIDILVEIGDSIFPIELKYKTRKISAFVENESFSLKNQGAQDIARYDILKDLERLEFLMDNLPGYSAGFAVWLTNDYTYWNKPVSKNKVDSEFLIHEGSVKQGSMGWASHAGEGTTKGRIRPIPLKHAHTIRWKPFSLLNHETHNNCFQYAAIEVSLN